MKNILFISDIHVESWTEGRFELNKSAIDEYLNFGFIKGDGDETILALGGDFVMANGASDYQMGPAKQWLLAVRDYLAERKLKLEKVVCVLGNHDLYRGTLKHESVLSVSVPFLSNNIIDIPAIETIQRECFILGLLESDKDFICLDNAQASLFFKNEAFVGGGLFSPVGHHQDLLGGDYVKHELFSNRVMNSISDSSQILLTLIEGLRIIENDDDRFDSLKNTVAVAGKTLENYGIDGWYGFFENAMSRLICGTGSPATMMTFLFMLSYSKIINQLTNLPNTELLERLTVLTHFPFDFAGEVEQGEFFQEFPYEPIHEYFNVEQFWLAKIVEIAKDRGFTGKFLFLAGHTHTQKKTVSGDITCVNNSAEYGWKFGNNDQW